MEDVDVRNKIDSLLECIAKVMSWVWIIIQWFMVLFFGVAGGYMFMNWLFDLSVIMKLTNTIPYYSLIIVLKAVVWIICGIFFALIAIKTFDED